MKGAFIKGKESLTVSYNGEVFTIPLGFQSEAVMEAIKEDRWEDIPSLATKTKAVETYSDGNITVVDGVVKLEGQDLPGNLSETIINLMDEGAPYHSFIRFWKRLQKNPSYRAVNELYGFLEAAAIPILDDGRILAYKVVRSQEGFYRHPGTYHYDSVSVTTKGGVPSYVDIHSGKVQQGIGDIVTMPRNQVDEDSNVTCSRGLHVCSWSYVNHFGNVKSGMDVVVEVAVDPIDVVAIPKDYDNAKMRTAGYQLLGINKSLTERRQAYVADYKEYNSYDGYEDGDDDDDGDIWFDDEGSDSFMLF